MDSGGAYPKITLARRELISDVNSPHFIIHRPPHFFQLGRRSLKITEWNRMIWPGSKQNEMAWYSNLPRRSQETADNCKTLHSSIFSEVPQQFLNCHNVHAHPISRPNGKHLIWVWFSAFLPHWQLLLYFSFTATLKIFSKWSLSLLPFVTWIRQLIEATKKLHF